MAEEVSKVDFDRVLNHVGEFGRYQKLFFLLLCLPAIICSYFSLMSTFLTITPSFRCRIPNCDVSGNATYQDAFNKGFADFTIPNDHPKCHHFKTNGTRCTDQDFDAHLQQSCEIHIFDHSEIKTSIVTEWNLVCDKEWKVPITESVFFAATLVSAPFFGVMADRFGRRHTFMVSIMCGLISGIPLAFSPNYPTYLAFLALVSFFQIGTFQTGFILAVESVGKGYRVFCGIFIEYFFVIGEFYLTLMAYVVREWRHTVLAGACPLALFLAYWPFLPESIRWLNSKNRIKEADEETKRLAKFNLKSQQFNLEDYREVPQPESDQDQVPDPSRNELLTFFTNKTLVLR